MQALPTLSALALAICTAAGLPAAAQTAAAPLSAPASGTPGAAPPATEAAEPAGIDLTRWQVPDLDSLPDDEEGRAVRLGHRLMTETHAVIGPEVADEAMRYAGNNLSCQNCHQEAGTKPYAMPVVGVTSVFPQYRARENRRSTIEERVNGCMERSMNGRPLPLDSAEMRAFVAYFAFLSQGIPEGASLIGAGTLPDPPPDRPADPEAGAAVFAAHCVACHGEDGRGQRNGESGDAQGFLFPALAGDDTYNDGAGMYRMLTAYRFILANMPQGATHDSPILTPDQAYDVAAYVNTRPRPHLEKVATDFPDLLRKPADMPFPPFADDFPEAQHKFGPFKPIQDWLKAQLAAREQAASPQKPMN
ncbi:c-type cytochrome [Paracoccus endophyticus]|uniref:c-type cytochrome n=1 Tax=Paracoccus endophyticus TaxID=2233774 RepID=UPI000DD69F77|nr:c-type cytochrome [Paracoccus endophyticus]